jgi:hypothetical protein
VFACPIASAIAKPTKPVEAKTRDKLIGMIASLATDVWPENAYSAHNLLDKPAMKISSAKKMLSALSLMPLKNSTSASLSATHNNPHVPQIRAVSPSPLLLPPAELVCPIDYHNAKWARNAAQTTSPNPNITTA